MSRLFNFDERVALVDDGTRRSGEALRGKPGLSTAAAMCLLLAATPAAQTAEPLVEAYARTAAILNGTTAYVGGSLLACAAANALSEAQAEERFESYRQRNSTLVARAEAWSREVELRLRAQGEEREARQRAEEAGLSAVASSSLQAEREIGAAPDVRAICAARLAAIDAGAFDLSRNPELLGLLGR
jgi:hypothetical protein